MSWLIRALRIVLFVSILVIPISNISVYAAAQDREIRVILDGKTLAFEVPPVQMNNHTFVPLRAIFEAHGAEITWNQQDRSMEAVIATHVIRYSIDSTIMYVDGRSIDLGIRAILVKNRMLVPVRAISEALGSKVTWDRTTRIITITTTKSEQASAPPSEVKLTLTPDERTKSVSVANAAFVLHVNYYGVKENLFYTSLRLVNNDAKDIKLSLAPGDKQIKEVISKATDPLPNLAYEDCTRVRYHDYTDWDGDLIRVPEFYTDSECTSRNEAKDAAFKEWQKKNSGLREAGSDTVTVRREIQAADGSLSNYVIPANKSIEFIISSTNINDSKWILKGSYFTEESPGYQVPISLEYTINKDMGLGSYDVYFTNPIYK
ncbi:stalk domain-containing protein [Paenibacillus sp. GCM10023252]|uniref:stalk domain-containing protein n=1 Tax=Paenibacillus sp. GCM10023252 TaxID=3252649 RepID=UPI003622C691